METIETNHLEARQLLGNSHTISAEGYAMATSKHLIRAESALRAHALAFPEACEEFPWDHRAIKVKKKIFVIFSMEDGVLKVALKLPVSNNMALSFPFASPTEYGLGKSGWVTSRFGATDDVPIAMLKEWIDESFRAVAPKRIVAKMENAERGEPKKAKRRKTK
jgi:predicted DNA-binding protein (MmcQ/YjbR family)